MYTESRDKNGDLNKHQLHHKSLVGLIGYTKNYPFWTKVEVTASLCNTLIFLKITLTLT